MKSIRKKTGGAVDLLHKGFDSGKCKTSLKLAMSRIKLLKNRRDQQVKVLRRELAQLLETGQDQTARIRVEHVIREEKTMSAYDLIELYCEIITARLPIIESQKNCPIDLKEAVSSVIFASPRCADVQELVDVRKHLQRKYGKEFVTSALELRPECGVSQLLVEKLSAKAPDVESKVKVLTAVAQEHDVHWEPKAFEEHLQTRNEDLLGGPSSFESATKRARQFVKPEFVTLSSQNHDPATNPNFTFQSSAEPTESRAEPRAPENKRDETVPGYSCAKEESSSSNLQRWGMGFKDATSAAEAAAESAERASLAARAAAEFASHGTGPKVHTRGSDEYFSRTEEIPLKLTSSKQREPNIRYHGQMDNDRTESTYHRNSGTKNQQRGVGMQDNLTGKPEREHEDYSSDENESSGSVSDNNLAEVTSRDADYTSPQRGSKERNTVKQNQHKEIIRKDDSDKGSVRGRSSRSISSSSDSIFDNDMTDVTQQDVVDTFSQRSSCEQDAVKHSKRKEKVRDHQEFTVSPSSHSTRISLDDGRDMLHYQMDDAFNVYVKASPFEEELPSWACTGARNDSDDDVGPGVLKGKLADYSFKSVTRASKDDVNWNLHQKDENHFKGNFGTDHGHTGHRQDSFNVISKPLFDDDRYDDDHVDVFAEIAKSTNDNKRDDLSSDAVSPPKFDDDADSLSSDKGDEIDSSVNIMRSGSVPHRQSTSVGSPSSCQDGQQLWGTHLHEVKEATVSKNSMQSSSGLHGNHSSPRRRSRWDDSGWGSGPHFFDNASVSSEVLLEEEETDREGLLSSSLNNTETEEIQLGLSFGNLSGGLKNKGLHRPPYVRSPVSERHLSSKETVSDASPTIKKPDHFREDWRFVNTEVHDQKSSNWESRAEVFKPRGPIVNSDLDDSESEDSLSHQAPQSKGYDGDASFAVKQPREFDSELSEKKQTVISVCKTVSETDNVQNQEPREGLQADASKESFPTATVYSTVSRSRRTRPSDSLLSNKKLDDGSLTFEIPSISSQRQYKSSIYEPSGQEVSDQRPRSGVKETGIRSSISSYDPDDKERGSPPRSPVVTSITKGISRRTRGTSSESNVNVLSKARKETSLPDGSDLQRIWSTEKKGAGFSSSISSYDADGDEERDSPAYSPVVISTTKGASQRTRGTSSESNVSILSKARKEASTADESKLQRVRSTDKKETGFRSSVSSYDADGNEERDSSSSSPIVLRGTRRTSRQTRGLSEESIVSNSSTLAETNTSVNSYVQRKEHKDEKHSARLPQIENSAQKESTKSLLSGSAHTVASENKESLKSSGSTHSDSSVKKVDPKPFEQPSSSTPSTQDLAQKGSSRSLQSDVNRVSSSDSNESSKPSENSNDSSHVHPKLPDYESFAAHFQSLRANRRQK